MNTPNIRYYARMDYSTAAGKKTPKYTITRSVGYYPPMETLIGIDGKISFQLLEKLKGNDEAPAMRLQGKSSLNFTGLKNFFTSDGKLSGFCYGYPFDRETYSSKNKKNPFFEYREDAFLFIIHQEDGSNDLLPTAFEMVVIEGGKVLAGAYCAQLAEGGFNDELNSLREQAR